MEMQVEDLFLFHASLLWPRVRVHDTGLTMNQSEIRFSLRGDSQGEEELDRDWKINWVWHNEPLLCPRQWCDHVGKSKSAESPPPQLWLDVSPGQVLTWVSSLTFLAELEEAVFFYSSWMEAGGFVFSVESIKKAKKTQSCLTIQMEQ